MEKRKMVEYHYLSIVAGKIAKTILSYELPGNFYIFTNKKEAEIKEQVFKYTGLSFSIDFVIRAENSEALLKALVDNEDNLQTILYSKIKEGKIGISEWKDGLIVCNKE